MTMPRELAEEFPDQDAAFERLTRENARFEALVTRSHELWLRIHDLERGSHPDEDLLRGMKTERLGVLDEMALILRGGKKAPSQARKDGRY